MMMFVTEIPATTSDGKTKYYDGVLVKAESFREAEKKAKKMNPELEVIGEYVSMLELGNHDVGL
jgi:hypothetical protein|tara:strand:+ start:697 stop:888 length:192 start_codon:yes stop_codon:yes gene_type:complete